MRVEVVYAGVDKQFIIELDLPSGTTARTALIAANIQAVFLESKFEAVGALEALSDRIGIFGKPVTLETVLKEGDRLEIYRPLHQDPKELRRNRAKKALKELKAAKEKR
jgi:uncharacterized protein